MLENIKTLQKKEAFERLKILQQKFKLMEIVVNDFEDENLVYYSEYQNKFFSATLYWLRNREDLVKIVEDVEKKNGILVYHSILTPTIYGAYFSMLYVSQYQDEWKNDKTELQEGLPMAYCINLADKEIAEFGGIQIKGSMGGILRTA